VIGTILALVLSRRSAEPQRTFVRATIVLTVLSIVPDVLVDAHVATKLTLALTHVVAAAIVIPALASRVSDR
jgi:peptidoglycan/LPS O-acetylase OafA/YrhL